MVDTTEQPWQPNGGIPGGRMKVLARHEDGWESALLNWLPPDLGGGDPHRHYHRSVRERGLVFDGELPMVEFEQGAPGPGEAVLFRAGFYMDRGPGCLHGLDPERMSASGFTILEWREGPGTYLMEEAAAGESVVEGAPSETRPLTLAGRPGVVIERDDLRLLDTHALPWEASGPEPGVRLQALTPGEVAIAYAPPSTRVALTDAGLGGDPPSAYVLGGSLELDGGQTLGAGCFACQRAGMAAAGVAGVVGCRILRF